MASDRVRTAAAEALREPVEAVVLGVHRSRWFWPALLGSTALAFTAITVLDLALVGIGVAVVAVICLVSFTQRQAYLARTPTRLALVRATRRGIRPSRLARVVQPDEITIGTSGPAMRTFTVDGTTYLVSKLYSADLDRVLAPR